MPTKKKIEKRERFALRVLADGTRIIRSVDLPWDVALQVARREDGTFAVIGLALHPKDNAPASLVINQTKLGKLPIADMLRFAVSKDPSEFMRGTGGAGAPAVLTVAEANRRLELTAKVWRRWHRMSKAEREASDLLENQVAVALGMSVGTARNYIKAARSRGLIPPSGREQEKSKR